jgi:formylglycine-generating enzyme required for sulfatase activity
MHGILRGASLLRRCIGIAVFVVFFTDSLDAQQPTAKHPLDEMLLDATTREWLGELRKRGADSSPEARRWRDNETEFKTVLHACVSQPPDSKAVTVVGRIGISGRKPVDPRGIASPCAILEGGFFATRVDEGVSTVPFRLLDHEPLDLPIPKGGTNVVNVGQITLKPLPRKSFVTAVGRILLETDPDVPRPPQVQVAWHILAERLTKEVVSFEYEPKRPDPIQTITPEEKQLHAVWTFSTRRVMHFEYDRKQYLPPPLVTRAARDGRIRTTGLVPAFYQVVVSAPGYITTSYYVDLTDNAGTTAELNPMPLLAAKSFTNSIGMEFVRIPPGEFPAKPYYEGEKVPALMTVPTEFYISKHEFSRGQYEKLTGRLATDFGVPQEKETNDHPLRLLVNKGAMELEPAFRICTSLTESPAEKSAGRIYRLPEEKEWVHACRAGVRAPFPVSDEELVDYLWNNASKETLSRSAPLQLAGAAPKVIRALGGNSSFEAMGMPGNMFETSINQLRPIGKGRANPWGLHDMQGNVREICIRWLEPNEAAKWSPSPRADVTSLENGWRLQVKGFSGSDFHSSVFRNDADDAARVGEIFVRGGGYMSADLECLRGRRLRGMDYGIGLRVVCAFAN